jgi:hypothetical protein
MTFLYFLKKNKKELNINSKFIDNFKNCTWKFKENIDFDINDNNKFPNFKIFFDEFLRSNKFKKLVIEIKNKHCQEYLKLFFKHVKNFQNLNCRNLKPLNNLGNKGK